MPNGDGGNGHQKMSSAKILTILSIVAALITISGGFFGVYNGLFNARVEISQSIAKNRTIIVDDLEIRRDHKNRELELLNEKLKMMNPTNESYNDIRDEKFIIKDSIDDLNRLIDKAKKK